MSNQKLCEGRIAQEIRDLSRSVILDSELPPAEVDDASDWSNYVVVCQNCGMTRTSTYWAAEYNSRIAGHALHEAPVCCEMARELLR